MTADQLREYVGARSGDAAVASCYATATELVRGLLATHQLTIQDGRAVGADPASVVIPEPVVSRAILEVGAELYHRKNTKNGVQQLPVADQVSPLRIARDPLVAARPLFDSYLPVGGFA